MRVVEGGYQQLTESFLTVDGDPINPDEFGQGPLVIATTADGDIIFEQSAVPDAIPGRWVVDMAFPEMGLVDEITVTVAWVFDTESGRHVARQQVIVEPVRQHRVSDTVIVMEGPEETVTFNVVVPWPVRAGDTVKFTLSLNNEIVARYSSTDSDVVAKATYSDRAEYELPITGLPPRLEPYSLLITLTPGNAASGTSRRTDMRKVWPVTQQVMVAASMVADFIDKARLENVIPELEYVESDLVLYLYRGLATFNSLPPRATNFFGTNMQGPLLEHWVTCACIHALSAQFLAESSLAFDLSGQTVSLNMDRSPGIESALGRLQDVLNSIVLPYRKLLGKAGAVTGDGSIGGRVLDGAQKFGVLGVTTSPTTRLGAGSMYGQSRVWLRAHYGIHR